MAVNVTRGQTVESQTPRTSYRNTEVSDKLEDLIKAHDEERLAEKIDLMNDKELAEYRSSGGKHDRDITLMHLAAYHCLSWKIMEMLLKRCKGLVLVERSKVHPKQTVLHILIITTNKKNVRKLLESIHVSDNMRRQLLNTSMDTSKNLVSSQTELIGGLPLSIAALTFDEQMVQILLENGARLYAQNHEKETVFHSLVRYSHHHPKKQKKALEMMKFLCKRLREEDGPRSVWLLKNEDSLTALQLAAQLTQPLLFDYIIRLTLVYRYLENSDGVFDFLRYDITEIDPAAIKEINDEKTRIHKENEKDAKMMEDGTEETATRRGGNSQGPAHELSVLEIINNTAHDFDARVKILNNHIVNNVVVARWKMWQCFFWVWAVLHLVVMIWYSTYTVYKARKFIDRELGGADRNFVVGSAFIFVVVSGILMVYSLVLLISKIWNVTKRKDRDLFGRLKQFFWPLSLYGLLLLVWPLFLFLDSVLFLNCWYENERCNPGTTTHVTTVTLMAGWSICPMFLRPLKKFSFFTVMLREVFVGDIVRFLAVFIPALASFSLAMHIIFLPSSPDDLPSCDETLVVNCTSEDFKTYPRTLLTMFKLMMGLTEIERLLDAPENLRLLAVILFIVFVLLTYGLMLNALIALMSNTCSGVFKNRDNQWKKERLAVMMFLQSCFPLLCWARRCVGKKELVEILDYQGNEKERKRFRMKIPTRKIAELGSTSFKIRQDRLDTRTPTLTDFMKRQDQQAKQSSWPTNERRSHSTGGTMVGASLQVTDIPKQTDGRTAPRTDQPNPQLPGMPDENTDDNQGSSYKYSHAGQ